MIRQLALLVPCVAVAACSGDDDADVAVVARPGVVQPEALGQPTPGTTNPCLVLTPTYPAPAAGDVDTSFGCGGVAAYADPDLDITVKAVAVQPDDKIVAVGQTYSPQSNHHEVWAARFTSAGALDTTFATAGIFTKSFVPFGGPSSAEAVVLQPGGAIVMGGGFWSEDTANAVRTAFVLRLLADGTLDSSFGTAGIVQTTSMTYVRALRLQTNGSIVAAGEKCTGSSLSCVAAVGRFSGTDGAVNVAFGALGFATTSFGGSAPSFARGAAVAGNNVVIAGRVTSGSETNAGLARYGATGLDTAFGTNGTASYDTADSEVAHGIANIGTGFVFVESMMQTGSEYFMFVRVDANGAAYPSFGFFGRFNVSFAGYGAQGYGLVVTPNSQIVAVGSAKTSTGRNRMAITRVNGGGTLDPTFSDDGYTMLSAGGQDAVANAVALQSTGRIIAGGWSRASGSGAMKRAVLVRVRSE